MFQCCTHQEAPGKRLNRCFNWQNYEAEGLFQCFFILVKEAGRIPESLYNPKEILFLEEWSRTKHDGRVSSLAHVSFTAFGLAPQLIGSMLKPNLTQ